MTVAGQVQYTMSMNIVIWQLLYS